MTSKCETWVTDMPLFTLSCHTLLLRDGAFAMCVVCVIMIGVSGILAGGLSRYVSLESLGLASGENLMLLLAAGGGVGVEALATGLWVWSLVVVSFLVIHVVCPGAIVGMLPFSVSFWVWCGGAVLLLTPIFSLGYRGLVHVLTLSCHGLWETVLGAAGQVSRGERGISFLWSDVASVGMPLRSLWSLGNWGYQCGYFAVRMWLVFVLHAFCVASFCVLWNLVGAVGGLWLPIYALPVGGFLGLSLSLGMMALLYLGIQVFVYVSFSVSFAYYCAAGYFGASRWSPRVSVASFSHLTLHTLGSPMMS